MTFTYSKQCSQIMGLKRCPKHQELPKVHVQPHVPVWLAYCRHYGCKITKDCGSQEEAIMAWNNGVK